MQRSARAEVSGLAVRLLSAAALAPLFLAAIYLGGHYADAVVLLGGAAMAFEWARLTAATPVLRGAETLAVATALGAVVLQALGTVQGAVAALALGAVLALALCGRRARAGALLAFGIVYIGAACLGFLWLRDRPDVGLWLVAWLIAVVWSTDIGAYLAGRSIGGPRMAKRISPRKTWSGLAGGLAAAAAASAILATWVPALPGALTLQAPWQLALAGAALAIVEQGGDLLESAAKRRVGVKDASGFIPGHGGVLDRCDGLVAASLALALLVAVLQAGT